MYMGVVVKLYYFGKGALLCMIRQLGRGMEGRDGVLRKVEERIVAACMRGVSWGSSLVD
jgi:hypothetical protein